MTHPTPLQIQYAIIHAINVHNNELRGKVSNTDAYMRMSFPAKSFSVIEDAISQACKDHDKEMSDV